MSDETCVEAVFSATLERDSAAERAVYLDSVCGADDEVRSQVEKLLRAHSKMGGFLDRPAIEHFDATMETTIVTQGVAPTQGCANATVGEEIALDFLPPSSLPDSLGRIGHYEVQEVIGRGGFGIVFRAIDQKLDRAVAIKVLTPQLAADPSACRRFLAEARSSARIRHTNVVQIYGVEEQPLPYLVMELIPGESLQQRLHRVGRLDPLEVARIGGQVSEGLAASHRMGLVHRDVKPDNILLEWIAGDQREEIHANIGDFGLARAADDASVSHYGIVAGTPMFMAPEQALGETLDQRADLFSLGSVLYYMCCGQVPFRGKSTYAVLRRVVEVTPRPIEDLFPETPSWLCEIIARLHAKKPDDRFTSAKEVAELISHHVAQMHHAGDSGAFSGVAPAVERLIPAKEPSDVKTAIGARTRMDSSAGSRWTAVAVVLVIALGSLGLIETIGVTNFHGTVIRLLTSEGTLVIQVDDPDVSVKIDGEELVITGAGPKELRLKPGRYAFEASKDGKLVRSEWVTITKNGRRVVRVRRESPLAEQTAAGAAIDAVAWERTVAAMRPGEQVSAVADRLKQLNPGFDGTYVDPLGFWDMSIRSPNLRDLSPVRAMPGLKKLDVMGERVTDLSPLAGLELTQLQLHHVGVSDLSPLRGMKLRHFDLSGGMNVKDLSPLIGMPMDDLTIAYTQVSDLTPLRGMKLTNLNCDSSKVTDLSPLRGIPLKSLGIRNTKVRDLTMLKELPLALLTCDNMQIGDAELGHLKACKSLKFLSLCETSVTAKGIDELQLALPQCKITWDGGVIEPK